MLYSQTSYANIFELNKDNLGKQELIELKYYIGFTLGFNYNFSIIWK